MKRRSHSLGMMAVCTEDGSILGEVEDMLFSIEDGRIVGWSIKKGSIFVERVFVPETSIQKYGVDVFLCSTRGIDFPEEEPHLFWSQKYCGASLINRKGENVSFVEDILIDIEAHMISGFLLKDKKYISLCEDVALRPRLVIVPENTEFPEFEDEKPSNFWSKIWE